MLGPRDLVLCSGTMLWAPFEDMLLAASAGGFRGLTLWPHDYQRARESGLSDAEMRHMLDDHGIEIADLDPLLSWIPGEEIPERNGEIVFASEEDFYAIADALGGSSLNLAQGFGQGTSLDILAEAFAGVCDRAADHGLNVTLEYLPWSSIPDARTALEVVDRANRANGKVLVDTWHHFRGSGDPEQLRALPGEKIGSTQISDAPSKPAEDLSDETMAARLLPGEGDIPLVEWLRILDENGLQVPIGVEVFSRELDRLPPVEVGRLAGESARRLLAEARGRRPDGLR